MSDYARRTAGQLVDQARYDSNKTNPPTPIDWRHVVELGVRAGYGIGHGVRAMDDK
jgi:hypothetical protein